MLQDKFRQKGAILVLTALALPMLICGTGLAVDLGNIYLQRARLQNAADAAALAGAHAYADNNEKVKSHPKADQAALQYITGKSHNLKTDENIAPPNYQAQSKDNITYYRVKLEKEVPLYFLKIFYSQSSFTVPAESFAAINSNTTNNPTSIFSPYMFIFKNKLHIVNSIENPDNFNISGQLRSTFDGSVIYTNKNYQELSYSAQTANLKNFFTQKAADEGLSVNQALAKNAAVYDTTTGQTTTAGYSHQASYSNYDYNSISSSIANNASASGSSTRDLNGQNLSTSEMNKNNQSRYIFTNTANINIDESLTGDINTPIYIDVKSAASVVNVNLSADTRRPIMLYTEGDSTQVHINLNGHTFRGIICSPQIDNNEGVLINANGGTFSGTIAAASINLQGGTGHYKFESFNNNNGNSSGSGTTNSSSTTNIRLAAPPSGLSWND